MTVPEVAAATLSFRQPMLVSRHSGRSGDGMKHDVVPRSSVDFQVHRLTHDDYPHMEALSATFGEAFNDPKVYGGRRPSSTYLQRLLGSDYFIALVALKKGAVVGGLAAYELKKFEQERSEIYIYDLAVSESHRREGIATALIQRLKTLAIDRGAYVIFVQADLGDEPAIAFYSKVGVREDVLHFDISVEGVKSASSGGTDNAGT